MNARELRQSFLDFFASKDHVIVPSAPMVVKDDPTLMFTNAGMNQFKDIFLGNAPVKAPRVANSQKCLRVSGKHNDLEEVGHDTYHHTMFEMLGNWSFGNYFKQEAIAWAWEYLTEHLAISKDNLYASVFEGDSADNIEFDKESYDFWKQYLPEERILRGNKKDNFWEMGDTGPCGPCSEIHIDIRSEQEKKKIPGKDLVNQDHPHVIEIWNLVFIQFNRKANGSLEPLPNKHVDTGMGFERLAMIVQGKQSNYDTDVFQPIISHIAQLANTTYGINEKQDIAMRVIADHIRTISFAIADGQLPSNIKAGYVIRRILRRAVRYGYTFLQFNEPFLHKLLTPLIASMGNAYPELQAQESLISKIIFEEEKSFLRNLTTGIHLLQGIIDKTKNDTKQISGVDAFTLYDTYGFPFDLTTLIAKEQNLTVNEQEFTIELEKQKNRARKATEVSTGDWIDITNGNSTLFIGYETTETTISIIKYREVRAKNKNVYQLVFDKTPFYAESGGQTGDSGFIEADGKKITIVDTQKENNLIIHITHELPSDFNVEFRAVVNQTRRKAIETNHTATHLLHEALQTVLGTHVEQKGSLVESERLRFDFAHFQKMSNAEIREVEQLVNAAIRANIPLQEHAETPIDDAEKMGAKALFGEKYGDVVRVIQFGSSIELCGGTHASSTGTIGFFKIISESAIAAGIRRIEAVTAESAETYAFKAIDEIAEIKSLLKSPHTLTETIRSLQAENSSLKKAVDTYEKEKALAIANELVQKKQVIGNVSVIIESIDARFANSMKDIAMHIKNTQENSVCVLAVAVGNKAQIAAAISQDIVNKSLLSAQEIIAIASKEIQGGGGGQAFFATAGGKNPNGISTAFKLIQEYITNKLS
ncbi:MAG: alanine--tRNA ligase [Bacteroidales bacterium]|nr:alanine--tRNA ligase [Bacteroidales bacterium]